MEVSHLPSLWILISILIGINSISIHSDADLRELQRRLKYRVPCHNKALSRRTYQKGNFWVFQNFVAANHGQIDCYSTVTMTVPGDYGAALRNLPSLVRHWRAPISFAVYAPGEDFSEALHVITHLRNCLRDREDSNLIREFVSFHLFLESEHMVFPMHSFEELPAYCEKKPLDTASEFQKQQNLTLYVNVARNVAQDAATTHFILPGDIELIPSKNLALEFLRFIAFDERTLVRKRVFVLPAFEVALDSVSLSLSKQRLGHLLEKGRAREFPGSECGECQVMRKWRQGRETDGTRIQSVVKRTGELRNWSPYFIGSDSVPVFEERHLPERKFERSTHSTILCLLDYDFAVLDNAFLVSFPGTRWRYPNGHGGNSTKATEGNELWIEEYKRLFGERRECFT